MQHPAPRPSESDLTLLVREHQATVWRYLRFLGCTSSDADDLTQETFLAVLGKPIDRFGPTGVRAYLRRVARNLVFKRRERLQRTPESIDLARADLAWDWYADDDAGAGSREALRACLAELTDAGRRAVELRFAEQLDRAAIAARMGLSTHGVKSLLQRTYARLRLCVERRLRREGVRP